MASSPAPCAPAAVCLADGKSPNAFLVSTASYDQFLFLEQGKVDTKAPDATKVETDAIPPLDLAKKLLSEFIGTFILIFACVATAITSNKPGSSFGPQGAAQGAAFTVMIVIFSTGHISGAHVNPAVTLAFASLGRFPWIQVPLYAAAQLLGSVCASFLLKGIYHAPGIHRGVTVPAGSDLQAFMFELIISLIMMFVVTAVATDTRAVGHLAPVAVAGTIYLNNLLASEISGASMNPVRTLGPALAASEYRGIWVYFLGPVIGTQLGALAYTLIRSKEDDSSTPSS